MYTKSMEMTNSILQTILFQVPDAIAQISLENGYGMVEFYNYLQGTLMLYEISGLPQKKSEGVFGFHIHEGKTCLNDTAIPYEKTGGHLNPTGQLHPYHLGDLPPIFADKGYTWGLIYIDKFQVKDIINHTLVIHEHADDMHSQPAGNSGTKIACGEIHAFF